MENAKKFQNDSTILNYEQILIDLRRSSELAYKRFLESGGTNILKYASELSESIMEALDSGLCYPNFDINKYLKEIGKFEKQ